MDQILQIDFGIELSVVIKLLMEKYAADLY